jgi:hypothetical protein
VEWRSLKSRGIRDRLDSAFHVVEREYGVTRLLDPEGNAPLNILLICTLQDPAHGLLDMADGYVAR